NERCQEGSAIGEMCSNSQQCTMENSECLRGICVCSEGYDYRNHTCVLAISYPGGRCVSNKNCYGNERKSQFSHCVDGLCGCPAGYENSTSEPVTCQLYLHLFGEKCYFNYNCYG